MMATIYYGKGTHTHTHLGQALILWLPSKKYIYKLLAFVLEIFLVAGGHWYKTLFNATTNV